MPRLIWFKQIITGDLGYSPLFQPLPLSGLGLILQAITKPPCDKQLSSKVTKNNNTKTTKLQVPLAKTQSSLGIHPIRLVLSLCCYNPQISSCADWTSKNLLRLSRQFIRIQLAMWDSAIVLCFVVCYFVSILVLLSSWWGRECWLLCFVCLPVVSWLLCGSSSRCHWFVRILVLWYFLIILTNYLYVGCTFYVVFVVCLGW